LKYAFFSINLLYAQSSINQRYAARSKNCSNKPAFSRFSCEHQAHHTYQGSFIRTTLPTPSRSSPRQTKIRSKATPIFLRWRVCGILFIDAVPLEYKEMALRAVAAVTDPALQQVKRRCLAALKHAQVESE
jgi:hypothetical protein